LQAGEKKTLQYLVSAVFVYRIMTGPPPPPPPPFQERGKF